MIKYYNSLKEYAESEWICRQNASKKYKNWDTELQLVPEGVKYYEIDKEAVVREFMNKLPY